MTYEEALEYSKEVLKQCETYIDKVIFFKGHYINAKNYVKLVVEALEKQIPKKPIKDGYMNLCSNCDSCKIELLLDGGFTETRFKHCPNCGQAIDWSEEK